MAVGVKSSPQMEKIKQLEQQVFAALGVSDQISPEVKESAIVNLIQLYQNVELIHFCISNFTNFASITSQVFTLSLITFSVKEKFSDLSGEIIQLIQQFLFNSLVNSVNENKLPEELLDYLIVAQSQLVLKVYPNPWADFFSFFFSLTNDNLVKRFLGVFCADINKRNPTTFQDIIQLRSHLRQTGVVNQIFQYGTKKIQENDTFGYKIISGILLLCPIDILCDQNFQNMILNGFSACMLQNPSSVVFVFEILENIVKYPTNQNEIKVQLMQTLVSPNTIVDVVKNCNQSDVYNAAASLISTASLYWQKLSDGPEYFILALNFIQLDESTASRVIYSAYSYMAKHPETNGEAVKSIMNRLIVLFSSDSVIDNYTQRQANAEIYGNAITLLLQNSQIEIQNMIIPLLESYVQSFNFNENPGLCAALIYVVYTIVKNQNFPALHDFMNVFLLILQVQPPYSKPQIIAFFNLAQLMRESQDKCSGEMISSILSVTLQIALIEDLNPVFRTFLLKGLPGQSPIGQGKQVYFPAQNPNNNGQQGNSSAVVVNPQLIQTYISSLRPEFVTTATILIQNSPIQEQVVLYEQYLSYFNQVLSSQTQSLDVYASILSFIKCIPITIIKGVKPDLIVIAQSVVENLKSIEAVVNNDNCLSLLIAAIGNVAQGNGAPAFLQLHTCAKGANSIEALIIQLNTIIKQSSINLDWIPPIVEHLFNIFAEITNEIVVKSFLELPNDRSVILIVQKFPLFIASLITCPSIACNGEYQMALLSRLVGILQFLINRFYNMPIIACFCIDPLTTLIGNQTVAQVISQALPSLIPCSLNLVYVFPMNLLTDAAKMLARKVYTFHNNVFQKYGRDYGFLRSIFEQLGAPPKTEERYLRIAELDGRQKAERWREFFQELTLFFLNLDV